MAPFSGEELTSAAPRFLGFWLNVVVGPVNQLVEAGGVGADAFKSGLVDGVDDFFNFRVLVLELVPSSKGIEPKLGVVDC